MKRERREIKMQASPYQEGSHSFLAQCGEMSCILIPVFKIKTRLSLEKPCILDSVTGFMTEKNGAQTHNKELFDRD